MLPGNSTSVSFFSIRISCFISAHLRQQSDGDVITWPPSCPQVLDDMHARPTRCMRPALVVNLDVKDSHEEAALAAPHALELCKLVSMITGAEGPGYLLCCIRLVID